MNRRFFFLIRTSFKTTPSGSPIVPAPVRAIAFPRSFPLSTLRRPGEGNGLHQQRRPPAAGHRQRPFVRTTPVAAPDTVPVPHPDLDQAMVMVARQGQQTVARVFVHQQAGAAFHIPSHPPATQSAPPRTPPSHTPKGCGFLRCAHDLDATNHYPAPAHQRADKAIKWRKGPIPAKGLTGRGRAKGKGPIRKGLAAKGW